MIKGIDFSSQKLPVLGHVPNFEFVESGGKPFGLEDMKGTINVVDFIFTNCPGACPVMSSKMVRLYQHYKGNDQIRFVSISVDPERDTLETLTQYAADQGVTDDRWVFLRAPIEQVVELSVKGMMLAADNLPMGHSTKFVLIDADGKIRGYYDGLSDASMEELKVSIRELAEHKNL